MRCNKKSGFNLIQSVPKEQNYKIENHDKLKVQVILRYHNGKVILKIRQHMEEVFIL